MWIDHHNFKFGYIKNGPMSGHEEQPTNCHVTLDLFLIPSHQTLLSRKILSCNVISQKHKKEKNLPGVVSPTTIWDQSDISYLAQRLIVKCLRLPPLSMAGES